MNNETFEMRRASRSVALFRKLLDGDADNTIVRIWAVDSSDGRTVRVIRGTRLDVATLAATIPDLVSEGDGALRDAEYDDLSDEKRADLARVRLDFGEWETHYDSLKRLSDRMAGKATPAEMR